MAAQPARQEQARRGEADEREEHDARARGTRGIGDAATTLDTRVRGEPERDRRRADEREPDEREV